MKALQIALVSSVSLVLAAQALLAQDQPGGFGGGGGGGRGGRGGFMQNMSQEDREKMQNMSQEERRAFFRERMEQQNQKRQADYMKRLREALKPANEEEWQILEVQIKQIGELRRTSSNRGGRGRGEGDSPAQQIREQSRSAWQELQELIKQESPAPEALKAAMAKYRGLLTQRQEAEKKQREEAEQKRLQAEAQLEQARTDLKSILTVRQEAVLLVFGILQ